jgi:hypothetical protein
MAGYPFTPRTGILITSGVRAEIARTETGLADIQRCDVLPVATRGEEQERETAAPYNASRCKSPGMRSVLLPER